ncbi:MAG: hypothetical protein PSN36_05350 [Gammaproteobacteria bacterium]|nr:hypothetical protein [Gammaproteobacteria bacterium]
MLNLVSSLLGELHTDPFILLVSAVIMEISDEWQSSKAYLSLGDD